MFRPSCMISHDCVPDYSQFTGLSARTRARQLKGCLGYAELLGAEKCIGYASPVWSKWCVTVN